MYFKIFYRKYKAATCIEEDIDKKVVMLMFQKYVIPEIMYFIYGKT